MPLRYKVVETSDVTDVELERILNEATAEGWHARHHPVRDARIVEAAGDGVRHVHPRWGRGRRLIIGATSSERGRRRVVRAAVAVLAAGVVLALAVPAVVPSWDAPAPLAGARFSLLAVGDTGHRPKRLAALTPQRAVGDALSTSHLRSPADLLVLLGDNFYPSGLEEGELETRIAVNLVAPYCAFLDLTAPLSARVAASCPLPAERRHPVPVRAVLGNHDWGAPESPDLQQDAIPRYLANWRLQKGGAFVEETAVGVSLVYFDSTHGRTREGLERLTEALVRARGPWRIVVTHHPIDVSPKGQLVREALDAASVPVHLWLAGHEHNLQLGEPGPPGPALQVIAGSGSHATGLHYDLPGRRVFRRSLGYARIDLTRGEARGAGGSSTGELVVSLVSVRPFPAARWQPARLAARFAVSLDGRVRVLHESPSDTPLREIGADEPLD